MPPHAPICVPNQRMGHAFWACRTRGLLVTFKLLFAFAAAIAMTTSAFAADPPRPPAAQAFKIGALQAWSLRDADFGIPNDGKTFGADVGPEEVTKAVSYTHLTLPTIYSV